MFFRKSKTDCWNNCHNWDFLSSLLLIYSLNSVWQKKYRFDDTISRFFSTQNLTRTFWLHTCVSYISVIRYHPGNHEPWSFQLKNCVALPDYTIIRRRSCTPSQRKQRRITTIIISERDYTQSIIVYPCCHYCQKLEPINGAMSYRRNHYR